MVGLVPLEDAILVRIQVSQPCLEIKIFPSPAAKFQNSFFRLFWVALVQHTC